MYTVESIIGKRINKKLSIFVSIQSEFLTKSNGLTMARIKQLGNHTEILPI